MARSCAAAGLGQSANRIFGPVTTIFFSPRDLILWREITLSHSFVSHTNALGQQFVPLLGPTVFLFDLDVDCLDINRQGFIADTLVLP